MANKGEKNGLFGRLERERIRAVVLPDFVITELKVFHAELKPDKRRRS